MTLQRKAPWQLIHDPEVTLATRTYGRGGELAILLCGGPGLSCDYMLPLAEELGAWGYRAVCFQPRGIAPSSWPEPASFGLAALASDVELIRERHEAERVHLFAHSFGGYVAWACLARMERVASLVLINACAPVSGANAAGQRHLQAQVAAALGKDRPRPHDPTARFLADVPAYFYDPSQPVPEPLRSTRMDMRVHRKVLGAIHPMAELETYAARYTGPALVLVGARDPLGRRVAEANAAALRRARLRYEVIENAGHFPWLEPCAPAFARRLEALLSPAARP